MILFFKDYSKKTQNTFAQIGFLYLDNLLGEYAVAAQVGSVEFTGQDSKVFHSV